MISRFYLFIFFAVLFACDTASNVKPPNDNYFLKYFGGDGDQIAVDLIVNSDGTFYILGNSRISKDSIQKVYLAHANAQGEVINQITYGAVNMHASDMELTSDGKIAVVVNKNVAFSNVASSNVDILLTRFTLDLKPLDSALLFFGPTNTSSENANALTELSDGGFIIEGFVGDINNQSIELHLRVDNQLKKYVGPGPGPWNETTGSGSKNVGVRALQNLSDGFYYTFGYTNADYPQVNSVNPNIKFGAFNYQDNGIGIHTSNEPIFEQSGVGLDNYLTDVVAVPSGGYLLVGVSSAPTEDNLKAVITNSNNPGLVFDYSGVSHDLIIKDNNSQSLLGKGPNPFATVYSSINNYNLILANRYKTTTSDILLTKVDNNLVSIWGGAGAPNYVSFGGDGDDSAAAVAELPDGHIMVLGTMQLGNPIAQLKIVLMKLNSSGRLAN